MDFFFIYKSFKSDKLLTNYKLLINVQCCVCHSVTSYHIRYITFHSIKPHSYRMRHRLIASFNIGNDDNFKHFFYSNICIHSSTHFCLSSYIYSNTVFAQEFALINSYYMWELTGIITNILCCIQYLVSPCKWMINALQIIICSKHLIVNLQ